MEAANLADIVVMLKPVATSTAEKLPEDFANALVDWFRAGGRVYPWRRTRDPWAILVSEIMLQQTTIASVLAKGFYTRFLERFPTTTALATADEAEVLRVWEGLGYYSRARNLQKAARIIEEEHCGIFPRSHTEILALPGVGAYTAGAVASFAYDLPEAIVDGNVARVLSRISNYEDPIDVPTGQRTLWALARKLMPQTEARDYNSALMELGQTLCRKGVPDCLECPVNHLCLTRSPEQLPKKKPRREMIEIDESVIYAKNNRGDILLAPENGTRRRGFWKLPQRAIDANKTEVLVEMRYVITHHKVSLTVHDGGDAVSEGDERWVGEDELAKLPIGAPYRKVLNRLSDE